MHQILIDGAWVDPQTESVREIQNPATLRPLGTVAECGPADVERAVAAARVAQPGWARMPAAERARLLEDVAVRIGAVAADLATLVTQEAGQPANETRSVVEALAACFESAAAMRPASTGGGPPPAGVVAVLAPFNEPLPALARHAGAALAAGSTVICKPPPQDPLASLRLAQAFADLPPGVANLVTGGAQTGAALVGHAGVDGVAFTGSRAIGLQIAEMAAAAGKHVQLELGSVDPLIVCRDADLDLAVPGAVWARLRHAGQACRSAKRLYVDGAILEDFVLRAHMYIGELSVGDPSKADNQLGPLITREAARRVEDQVARSMRGGARLVLGGFRFRPEGLPGHFFQPTILSHIPQGSVATCEEILGPVLTVTPFADLDEALRHANDGTPIGGASIYATDAALVQRVRAAIRAAVLTVNAPPARFESGLGGVA